MTHPHNPPKPVLTSKFSNRNTYCEGQQIIQFADPPGRLPCTAHCVRAERGPYRGRGARKPNRGLFFSRCGPRRTSSAVCSTASQNSVSRANFFLVRTDRYEVEQARNPNRGLFFFTHVVLLGGQVAQFAQQLQRTRSNRGGF